MRFGLSYVGDGEVVLQGFFKFNWTGSPSDRKSTSGCCFSLGSGMVSWFGMKQTFIALSSAEAEYMVASCDSFESIWLCKLLIELID